MYRRLRELAPGEISELKAFLESDPLHNIHMLSTLELMDPRASVVLHRIGGKVAGALMRVYIEKNALLWASGELTPGIASMANGENDAILIITEDRKPWIHNSDAAVEFHSERLMAVDRKYAVSFSSSSVRLLRENDAGEFSASYEGIPIPMENTTENSRRFLRENNCFGLFTNEGKLVSRGRIQAKSSYGWAIGGVYTLPEYRNRGYATSLVSGLAEYALEHTGTVILMVRDDNAPAIKCYRKTGFRDIGKVWFIHSASTRKSE